MHKTHFHAAFWRSCAFGLSTMILSAHACAAITGEWEFASGTLAATTGQPLEYVGGSSGDTALATQFGSASSFGLPTSEGWDVPAMKFAKCTPTMGYRMFPGVAANGGGTRANQYTIFMEIYYPASSANTWRSLIQIDPANTSDGDVFLDSNGAFGISGTYDGTVPADTWCKLAWSFDGATSTMRKYINGTLVGTQTLAEGTDQRWSLPPAGSGTPVLLFADEDNETATGYVSWIRVYDTVLSDSEIAEIRRPAQTAAKDWAFFD